VDWFCISGSRSEPLNACQSVAASSKLASDATVGFGLTQRTLRLARGELIHTGIVLKQHSAAAQKKGSKPYGGVHEVVDGVPPW
jgi:hypothetical protein